MKRISRIFTGIGVVSAALFSCSEDDFKEAIELPDSDVSSVATVDAMFDEIDDIAEYGASQISSEGMRFGNPDGFKSCATVSYDTENQILTLNFGEGDCTGVDGRVRKGKIHFTHAGEFGKPGETRIVTLEGFEIDGIAIQGTRTFMNISEENSPNRIISLKLAGGIITFAKGNYITRASNKTRTIYFNDDQNQYEATVSGTASGSFNGQVSYTYSVDPTTPLLYTKACAPVAKIAPVSGILTLEVDGKSDVTVDYGDGTCDNIATISRDGISTEIEITSVGRKPKK